MFDRHSAPQDAAANTGAAPKKGAKAPSPPPQAPSPDAPKMQFEVADAQSLPQDWANRFDIVIDKAMLDAVACSGKDKSKNVRAVLQSVNRVLKPSTGIYVCVSHAGPELRRHMLIGTNQKANEFASEYNWKLTHKTVPRPLKNPLADPKAKPIEFVPSTAFKAEENVFHIYIC